ncbi:hypothetical protein QBC38DRAFT_442761 [Podospora fimiseda]|uniref:BHLH domain-containing protein n=1 Tax=Podospora fimiseda TaxID=252190 RepID=A0AAN7BSW5_9PEZI|nr:hypothetical protein QBC38DRAFT_442761 [Podospora fimiseda]
MIVTARQSATMEQQPPPFGCVLTTDGFAQGQGQQDDPSIADQEQHFLSAFGGDPNRIEPATHGETLLTQGGRAALHGFLENFSATGTGQDFEFSGFESYGEGVEGMGAISSWGPWISPDSVIGHGVIPPNNNHSNATIQLFGDVVPFHGTPQYLVSPQHIFNNIPTQMPDPAAQTIPMLSHRPQQQPVHAGPSQISDVVVHNMPMLPGRSQQETINPPRQFHQQIPYELPAELGFSHQSRPVTHRPQTLSFGSDPNFNNGCYVPPSTRETVDAIAANTLATLGCLQPNLSAAPTRAPSPEFATPSTHIPEDIVEQPDIELDSRPIKRRKSSKPEDEQKPKLNQMTFTAINATEEENSKPIKTTTTDPSPLSTPVSAAPIDPKQQKSTVLTDPGDGPPAPPVASKRKRNPTVAQKPPRENLTEEQKRSNHIRSEQKRRNAIKTGFDELNRIIPACKGGGYSKAIVLNHTYDFVAKMHEGNWELEKLLEKHGLNVGTGRSRSESKSE